MLTHSIFGPFDATQLLRSLSPSHQNLLECLSEFVISREHHPSKPSLGPFVSLHDRLTWILSTLQHETAMKVGKLLTLVRRLEFLTIGYEFEKHHATFRSMHPQKLDTSAY